MIQSSFVFYYCQVGTLTNIALENFQAVANFCYHS